MTIFDQLMQEEYDGWGIHIPEHPWCTEEQTRLEIEFLKRTLCLSKADAILDLQCSWGRHALMLGAEGYNLVGVDISESLIARAKQMAASSQCTATFEMTDFREMRFKSQFDVVYQIQASFFEAWRTPDEVYELLLSVQKILRQNGRYLFGWKDDWNTAKGSEQRWRQLLKKKGITTYESCELPFYDYGVAKQTEIVRKAGFAVAAIHNQYDPDELYDESRTGLLMIVKKAEIQIVG
jgi:SAM-dependent methyltransferase